MGRNPWPFVFLPPIALITLVVLGFTQTDIVEKDINNIWTSTSGRFYDDVLYLKKILNGTSGREEVSTFSALAVSRDGGNLFQASRLQEITERMKELANVTVSCD